MPTNIAFGSAQAKSDIFLRIIARHEIGLSGQCKCKGCIGNVPGKNYFGCVENLVLDKHGHAPSVLCGAKAEVGRYKVGIAQTFFGDAWNGLSCKPLFR